tara:strand:+ start:5986 stop:6954 length:969 start_codon:yes stop_codon:yes gene_type:complete
MVKLLHVNDYSVDTSQFQPLLNDSIVEEFEQTIADFVGAKYAVSMHSATSAIFLSLLNKNQDVSLPSILPPVVANAVLTANNRVTFEDNIEWVGGSYVLHTFKKFDATAGVEKEWAKEDYKIIDSAQQIYKNQFKKEAKDNDLMIYSFYPTKPIGSSDGGMIVSNDKDKIDELKILSRNGNTLENNSWERQIVCPGYKLYMNSIQCYIALENYKKLKDKTQRFEEVKGMYNDAFGLKNTSNHLYRINVEDRNTFMDKMNKVEIQTGIHYKALHKVKCYGGTQLSLPKSELESDTTVSLPYHEKLTDTEVKRVIKEVKPYVKA